MPDLDLDHLKSWIGRERTASDLITPRLAASLNAVLDVDGQTAEGEAAPVGIHWCLAPDIVPMSGIGPDGHPERGDFLPPVPFPRRMWAGGELGFQGDFHIGERVTRRSTIEDVVQKTGRTGEMVFVTVRHLYSTSKGIVLDERQDIVYRGPGSENPSNAGPAAPAVAEKPGAVLSIKTDPVLLFRYSAITFNGHRIHYDHPYVTGEEGYPGLIVHGPLQATYLLKLASDFQDGRLPRRFSFRSTRPLFAGDTISIGADTNAVPAQIWAADESGQITMKATATIS
jgi:3-methylfumaryl-CoA hydratase